MSTSQHIEGFRDMDGEFAKMLEIKLFCDAHAVSYPAEVEKYFDGEASNTEEYLRNALLMVDISQAVEEYKDTYSLGVDIHLDRLSPEVKFIRFRESW